MPYGSTVLTITGLTPDADGVSLSQSVPGAAGVVIDGAYASGYDVDLLSTAAAAITTATLTSAAASIIPPRQIVVASDGDESGATVALVGTDVNNAVISETITGPNTTRTATTKFFSSLISATMSTTSVGSVSVGVNGFATLTQPRRVAIASAGNDAGVTFTVTGTDAHGSTHSETVTGASGAAAHTVLSYKAVTGVVASAATASTMTVGSAADSITGDAAYSTYWFPDTSAIPFAVGIGSSVSGTAAYNVQHMFDDPNTDPTTWTWANNSGIANKSAADGLVSGNYAFPVTGVRVSLISGTGTVTCRLIQAGD